MRDLLPRIDPNLWMEVSAIVFLLFFTGLVVWTYLPSRQALYDQRGKLPLDED